MRPVVGDDLEHVVDPGWREVELPARAVRRLYAADGRVLVTVSDRPPVGFHQGERAAPAR